MDEGTRFAGEYVLSADHAQELVRGFVRGFVRTGTPDAPGQWHVR
ncbi:hypothetical protein [Streptomyces sp. NPDC096105]